MKILIINNNNNNNYYYCYYYYYYYYYYNEHFYIRMACINCSKSFTILKLCFQCQQIAKEGKKDEIDK